MKVRAHLFIRGRVQGVGYRAFAMGIASSMGLSGWVRNLADRQVEAVFEGERWAIEAAIKKCAEGPISAVVSDIDVSWDEQPEGLTGFGVRY